MALPEPKTLVPPPGGETPGKRSKPGNNQPSGSKDPTLGTIQKLQAATAKAVDPPNNPVGGLARSFEG